MDGGGTGCLRRVYGTRQYPDLGGPNDGKTSFTIPKADLLAMMRRDVASLKSLMSA